TVKYRVIPTARQQGEASPRHRFNPRKATTRKASTTAYAITTSVHLRTFSQAPRQGSVFGAGEGTISLIIRVVYWLPATSDARFGESPHLNCPPTKPALFPSACPPVAPAASWSHSPSATRISAPSEYR